MLQTCSKRSNNIRKCEDLVCVWRKSVCAFLATLQTKYLQYIMDVEFSDIGCRRMHLARLVVGAEGNFHGIVDRLRSKFYTSIAEQNPSCISHLS